MSSRHVTTNFEQGKFVSRLTIEGQSYNFKTDGEEYPAIFGSTAGNSLI